jgi:hypothetical protein
MNVDRDLRLRQIKAREADAPLDAGCGLRGGRQVERRCDAGCSRRGDYREGGGDGGRFGLSDILQMSTTVPELEFHQIANLFPLIEGPELVGSTLRS